MDFWSTVAGNRLASILSSELPALNDNLEKLDNKEVLAKLDAIIEKLDRIEDRVEMLESEYAEEHGFGEMEEVKDGDERC